VSIAFCDLSANRSQQNLVELARSVWDRFKTRPHPPAHSATKLLMIIEPVIIFFDLNDPFSLMLILRCYGVDHAAAFEWLAFEVAAVLDQLFRRVELELRSISRLCAECVQGVFLM
jgi:hypothetical protein